MQAETNRFSRLSQKKLLMKESMSVMTKSEDIKVLSDFRIIF